MAVTVESCTAAIRHHTEGLARVAAENLDRRVEHCPDWSVADLVWHLTGVHRFWSTVVTELPSEPPDEASPDDRPADDDLVPGMLAAMETLVAALGAADQDAQCWTWGLDQRVWFVTRHQVQEAAVHHWDALNAAGRGQEWQMDDELALDAVDEFLTHSVANTRWPMPGAPAIGGTLRLGEWDVTDGSAPGTVAASRRPDPASDVDPNHLLLWLFRRLPEPGFVVAGPEEQAMIDRFRALTSTD